MDITGTYRGFAPDGNLVCWREVEMIINGDVIRFRAAGNDGEIEEFSISIADETQPMTQAEIAKLFDKKADLSNAYGLFLGDKNEGVILLWRPVEPDGDDYPRVVKRNLVEDEMSVMLRWSLFDTAQIAHGRLDTLVSDIKALKAKRVVGEEVQIMRLPNTN